MKLSLLGMLAAVVLLMAGCGSTPKDPTPEVIKVSVPIPEPCHVQVPQEPAYAVDALPIGSGIWDQMAALRAERLQRAAYLTELVAAIQPCQ